MPVSAHAASPYAAPYVNSGYGGTSQMLRTGSAYLPHHASASGDVDLSPANNSAYGHPHASTVHGGGAYHAAAGPGEDERTVRGGTALRQLHAARAGDAGGMRSDPYNSLGNVRMKSDIIRAQSHRITRACPRHDVARCRASTPFAMLCLSTPPVSCAFVQSTHPSHNIDPPRQSA